MKIYTKKGDSGTTQLIGGTRVPKHHPRTEAYGTLDELLSLLGVLYDFITDEELRSDLRKIQGDLFRVGTFVALDPSKAILKNGKPRLEMDDVKGEDVEWLEGRIDAYEANLPPMKFFVLPGGNKGASFAHVCRTVARRAERRLTELDAIEKVKDIHLQYLNRLSDYLFVLARKLTYDSGTKEFPWIP